MTVETSWIDPRDTLIARVVSGRSFADVGGLWGTVNEKVSVALRAGAGSGAMVDIAAPGAPLWDQFRDRMTSFGLTDYQCISSDVCQLADGCKYDVVHSSGILYHHPNPLMMLEALHRITGQYLILTSAITHEEISTTQGVYRIPGSGAIFVPALTEQERKILTEYWEKTAGDVTCYGINHPVEWRLTDFGPWWWLPTARCMRAMCEAAGFRVLEAIDTWNSNAHTLLLTKTS